MTSDVPDDFSGIPVLNNLKATFYFLEEDIEKIWTVYTAALMFAENKAIDTRQAFCRAYDQVLGQKGIRWNITMGLYWVRPYTFINLDSRNRWYMRNPNHMPASVVAIVAAMKAVPTAEMYLELRDKCLEAQ